MLMDVVTDFGQVSATTNTYTPTQADKLERGPVRLRSALQFSLNIPAIKAGHPDRPRSPLQPDPGLRDHLSEDGRAGRLDGDRDARDAPDRPARRVRHDRRRRRPRPAAADHLDRRRQRPGGCSTSLPQTGTRVVSNGAAAIITDILAGNTDTKVNPYWGKWAIYDGKTRRPAAYKTGTTSDNRDVAAYGYLAPPADDTHAGARRRRLDGQQRQHAERRQALARHLGAALVGDPDRDQQGPADRRLPPPSRPRDGDRRRVHRPAARPVHDRDRRRAVPAGHRPDPEGDDPGHAPDRLGHRAALAGRLRRARGQRGVLRPDPGRCQLPGLAAGRRRVGRARGARAPGVKGGPEGTRTSYFYNNSFAPFGRTWGAPFAPTELCPVVPPPLRPARRPVRPAVRSAAGPCEPPATRSSARARADAVPTATVPERRLPVARDGQRDPRRVAGYAVGDVQPRQSVARTSWSADRDPGAGTPARRPATAST